MRVRCSILSRNQRAVLYVRVDDAALHSLKDALFLSGDVEKGFDNGWIAIVSDGSVEVTPIEWKISVLNAGIRNSTVYSMLKPENGVIR